MAWMTWRDQTDIYEIWNKSPLYNTLSRFVFQGPFFGMGRVVSLTSSILDDP